MESEPIMPSLMSALSACAYSSGLIKSKIGSGRQWLAERLECMR